MLNLRLIIPAVIAAALLITGCSTVSTDTGDDIKTVQLPNMLTGSSWTATRIFGQDADAATSELSIDADGSVSGNAACNVFQGSASINGSSISFGQLATTRKMCSPAIDGQEIAFLEALSAARYWQRLGSTLEFTDEKNGLVLRFTEAD